MNIRDLKLGDLQTLIEKKLINGDRTRTIDVKEICDGYVAINYLDDTGAIVGDDYFDLPESNDGDARAQLQDYLYEAIEYLRIIIGAIV